MLNTGQKGFFSRDIFLDCFRPCSTAAANTRGSTGSSDTGRSASPSRWRRTKMSGGADNDLMPKLYDSWKTIFSFIPGTWFPPAPSPEAPCSSPAALLYRGRQSDSQGADNKNSQSFYLSSFNKDVYHRPICLRCHSDLRPGSGFRCQGYNEFNFLLKDLYFATFWNFIHFFEGADLSCARSGVLQTRTRDSTLGTSARSEFF